MCATYCLWSLLYVLCTAYCLCSLLYCFVYCSIYEYYTHCICLLYCFCVLSCFVYSSVYEYFMLCSCLLCCFLYYAVCVPNYHWLLYCFCALSVLYSTLFLCIVYCFFINVPLLIQEKISHIIDLEKNLFLQVLK